jgi:hypothetical protein
MLEAGEWPILMRQGAESCFRRPFAVDRFVRRSYRVASPPRLCGQPEQGMLGTDVRHRRRTKEASVTCSGEGSVGMTKACNSWGFRPHPASGALLSHSPVTAPPPGACFRSSILRRVPKSLLIGELESIGQRASLQYGRANTWLDWRLHTTRSEAASLAFHI